MILYLLIETIELNLGIQNNSPWCPLKTRLWDTMHYSFLYLAPFLCFATLKGFERKNSAWSQYAYYFQVAKKTCLVSELMPECIVQDILQEAL